MPPSSPSELFWTALSPLVQQLEALGRVLEACATYVPWCAGCATGLALLLLTGLVLQDARNGGGERGRNENANSARDPQENRAAEPFEWGLNG
ncbi:MAG: hypothetical protein V5A20_13525 [Salinibacter sp.]|uniref:hypothetical protein n=1 Tax=Salinibacter sp. TaxID=2065818 RepID=UPI002FC32788